MKKIILYPAFIVTVVFFLSPFCLSQEMHGGIVYPAYEGGNSALKECISKQLFLPDSLKNKGISGQVTVSFKIDKHGEVEDIKLIRGIHPVCDSLAIMIVRKLSGWKPGTNMVGKPMEVKVLLPIQFGNESSFSVNKPSFVSGNVTDKVTGAPIEGALIVVKGTSIGTLTDANGYYQLSLEGNPENIEIIALGYQYKLEPISNNNIINVELQMDYFKIEI